MNRPSPYVTDYWTEEDHLGFSDFLPALEEIILEAETPLTVGVFGAWGSGKTSFMRQLRKRIENKKDPRVRTVWFTAWKYDRHDALWRAFILRVLDAFYPREDGEGPREERPRIPMDRLDEQQREIVDYLQRLEASVYRPVEWQELGKWTVDVWQALAKGGDVLVDIAAAFIPGGDLFKRALTLLGGDKETREELGDLTQALRREVHTYRLEQLASLEQFERVFAEVLQKARPQGADELRLIVFVDDLDRCLPEKAVEVLEAIKLFLEVPGTVFVLGMDKDVIVRGIETHYGAMLRHLFSGAKEVEKDGGREIELPITGEVYLQKIVQIPFYLPLLSREDLETYVEQLRPSGSLLDETTRAILAIGVSPNPRQVKRVLNIFHLLRKIARTKELAISDPLLMKTVLIQAQWPELYRAWRNYPPLIQLLEKLYMASPEDDRISEHIFVSGEEDYKPVLFPYVQHKLKYRRLKQMLLYPEGITRKTHFRKLSSLDIATYLRLAETIQKDIRVNSHIIDFDSL